MSSSSITSTALPDAVLRHPLDQLSWDRGAAMAGAAHGLDGLELSDYEALPPTVSTSTHMMAGALAGIMEHCVMYPIDSVKVS